MTHIAPDTYDSGVQWNGTRILVSHQGRQLYTAYFEGVEPPTGHVLDEPEPHYYHGWGATRWLAVESVLQDLVEGIA